MLIREYLLLPTSSMRFTGLWWMDFGRIRAVRSTGTVNPLRVIIPVGLVKQESHQKQIHFLRKTPPENQESRLTMLQGSA